MGWSAWSPLLELFHSFRDYRGWCWRSNGRLEVRFDPYRVDNDDRSDQEVRAMATAVTKEYCLSLRSGDDEIVPAFQAQDFNRFRDYAGGSTFAVGPNCIPLQRRSGSEWPTVEILFDKRNRPALGVTFALLPEYCRRWSLTEHRWMEIPRTEANVVEGPASFALCKGHGGYNNGNFGYYYWALYPRRKLCKEVGSLKSLLPWLFDLFDNCIPRTWLERPQGYVGEHAFLVASWKIIDRLEKQGRR